ncbi:hypothetical protein K474DRAFT_1714011 [Panus rudis PR-1116 ss-1]|nr:hypothetical protein K474DRAFT_1714011 [Panus rudis PR-1116 ss-1]
MPSALQKSDKKHHVSTNTTAPAKASQVSLQSPGKRTQAIQSGGQAPSVLVEKKTQKEPYEMSTEQKLQEIEKLSMYEHLVPFDVWAQPAPTFDLLIPSWTSPKKDATLGDHIRSHFLSHRNFWQNLFSMWRLARANSFPGVKLKGAISPNLFRIQSTPWLAPFRQMALENYQTIQQAVAAGDEKTIKKYTVDVYRTRALQLARGRNPSHVYVWNFHGENSPCKVVSIRCTEANLSAEPPKIGNRLLVQALVKFDTNQSLQIYNKRGVKLGGDENPRRVVEYLVFQKRMWYDTPWVVRDQLYEGVDAKYNIVPS